MNLITRSLNEGINIDIIYFDGECFTKRKIRVHSLTENAVEAYCYLRKAPRTFKTYGILAVSLHSFEGRSGSYRRINNQLPG
ncbi:transcriptional regulator [Rossellomorea marisflavi]|uniref:transcriptional regulator n=1 Tax=Rossellomorea marisflavi TaxID=189381 RepID=UPI001277BCEF|nr:transcriptional regulator [Rossellomorea marisflavi]TYO72072.1 transcriptional regulator [Rossellomorea marisflavi]